MAVVVEPADADALPDVRDGAAMAVVVEPADADALPDVSPVYLYSSFANGGPNPWEGRLMRGARLTGLLLPPACDFGLLVFCGLLASELLVELVFCGLCEFSCSCRR